MKTFFLLQLESLLQLWLTLSLNTTCGSSEESGSDIFLFNASRVPTIPLNQGQKSCQKFVVGHVEAWPFFFLTQLTFCFYVFVHAASISSFLTVLAWYPNTSLRTWCLVLHSLTLMINMTPCGQFHILN